MDEEDHDCFRHETWCAGLLYVDGTEVVRGPAGPALLLSSEPHAAAPFSQARAGPDLFGGLRKNSVLTRTIGICRMRERKRLIRSGSLRKLTYALLQQFSLHTHTHESITLK